MKRAFTAIISICVTILSFSAVACGKGGYNTEPTYVFNDDNSECTATLLSGNGETAEKETVATTKKVLQEKTCTVDGIVEYTAVFTKPVFDTATKKVTTKHLGHIFASNPTIDVYPTATTDGSKSYHCLFCDEKKDVTVIPAGENVFGDNELEYRLTKDGYAVSGRGNFYGYYLDIPSFHLDTPVVAIDANVFEGATDIQVIRMDNRIKTIGDNAFKNCKSLYRLTISANVEKIGKYAFAGCEKLADLSFYEGSSRVIDTGAFKDCKGLVGVEILAREIGESAFEGCENLKILTLDNDIVSKIGARAFGNCKSLQEINFSSGIESIGENAFEGCGEVQNVTLPKNLTRIEKGLFYKSNVRSVVIPASVTYIGSNAFGECSELGALRYEGSVDDWPSVYKEGDWNLYTSLEYVQCKDNLYRL